MNAAAEAEKQTSQAVAVLNQQLETRLPQIALALPAHIPPERFKRVILTAVQRNPKLLNVSRQSFFNACMLAAHDGLLPDGREGAIVDYGGQAQWLPMVQGIRKKARNSGEISDLYGAVVFKNDVFKYQRGDNPFVHHEPTLEDDPGPMVAAYSICVLKDGTISRDVMPKRDIEKRRKMSKASRADSPWNTWTEEMWVKTVIKHHAKGLPTSTDLDDLLRRDDELFNFAEDREESKPERGRPKLHALLDQVAETPKRDEDPAQAGEGAGADGNGARPEPAPASDQDQADLEDDRQFLNEASEPTPNPERDELLDAVRSKSLEGSKKLRWYKARLRPDQIALLTEAEWKQAEAAATKADQPAPETTA